MRRLTLDQWTAQTQTPEQVESEKRALRLRAFVGAYTRLADQGKADAYGGCESSRVWREWTAARFPEDVEAFIYRQANVLPFS